MTIHISNSENGNATNNNININNNNNVSITIPPDIDNPPSYLPLKSLNNRYHLLEKLGTGSFGSVILAKANFNINTMNNNNNEDNDSNINSIFKNTMIYQSNNNNNNFENYMTQKQNLVAIKTMMTKLNTLHDYTRVREIKFILSIPTNKHIIQIFEIFIDNINFQLHIVMESMEQNLYQLMKNRRHCYFSIPTLKSILAQILEGIKHIHSYNYFHRDIKPENILVSTSTSYFDKKWLSKGFYEHNYVVKLADFGLARNINNRSPYTEYVSTRWYRSPEILLRNGFYSKPIDIWAFGCVAVEVANFKPLFPGSDEMDQIWKILQILGTPTNINLNLKEFPEAPGGRWDHIEILAKNLELEIPYIEGISINPFLSSTQLSDLIDVVKNCLLWDPELRMTAEQLSQMSFFKDTLLQTNEEENINQLSNKDQAMMFAGIKTDKYFQNNNKDIIRFQPKNYIPCAPQQIYDGDNILNDNIINNEQMFIDFERDSSPSLEDDDDDDDDEDNEDDEEEEEADSDDNQDDQDSNGNTFEENIHIQNRFLPTNFNPQNYQTNSNIENVSQNYSDQDPITEDVTRLLSSYKINKEIPTSDYYTPDDGLNNIRRISDDIDIITKENSGDIFNDYAMETPLLNDEKQDKDSEILQYEFENNSNNNDNDMIQHQSNQHINNNNGTRTLKINNIDNHTIFSDSNKISSEYDITQDGSNANYTFHQMTPRSYFNNNDNNNNNHMVCSKADVSNKWTNFASSNAERNSNSFYGNVTF